MSSVHAIRRSQSNVSPPSPMAILPLIRARLRSSARGRQSTTVTMPTTCPRWASIVRTASSLTSSPRLPVSSSARSHGSRLLAWMSSGPRYVHVPVSEIKAREVERLMRDLRETLERYEALGKTARPEGRLPTYLFANV
jgi:hypothetical protein